MADSVIETVSLRAVLVVLDRIRRGIKETSHNRGPEVDKYALGVGLDPAKGYPWCTSGLYDAFKEAAEALGSQNPFPQTAKAVHVWEVLYRTCYEPDPAPGLVYVLDHGVPGDILTEWKLNRYTNNGHIGIVTSVDADGVPTEGSGNTNVQGSREGNAWALHTGYPEVSHGGVLLGFLDLERALTS